MNFKTNLNIDKIFSENLIVKTIYSRILIDRMKTISLFEDENTNRSLLNILIYSYLHNFIEN